MNEAPLAAIDIGTNSFHLVIARPIGNGRFEVIDREKETVRLGSGSGDMKELAPDAVDRGIDALRRLRRLADSKGAEVHAVATSAVREADNRDDFLRRAYTEAGVEVKVVSGAEEARLIHLGVLQAVQVFDQRHLVIDIGGGSTEIVVGEGTHLLEARSVKLGAIRLTDRFFRTEPVKRRALDECRQYIRSFLAPFERAVRELGFDVAVGSSGTIMSTAEMARALRKEPALTKVSGSVITRADVDAVVSAVSALKTVEERATLAGLDTKRADIILAGVLIIEQTFIALGINELIVSDFALREGVLLDALQRRERTSLGHLRDLRYESVAHLAAIAPGERDHSEHATELALRLFEQTQDLHDLESVNEEFLEAAGLLSNVGLFVAHARHHLHSYYIIRNSDLLSGFTDDEVELIALTARYHRKSAPKPSHTDFAKLKPDAQRTVRLLSGILRIAFALDRSRSGMVHDVSVSRDGDELLVEVVADGDANIELYTADARKALLETALGVTITFRQVGRDRIATGPT
jgi:exopolyphosphatase/guanosine-5'-triphosphate,3'-diphosphate pyrophosphatase